jgi:hypothetical protein
VKLWMFVSSGLGHLRNAGDIRGAGISVGRGKGWAHSRATHGMKDAEINVAGQ